MERFTIEGGVALSGSVRVSGSKNAVLALMACSLLTEDRMAFANAPRLRDVETMIKILEGLGVRAGWESGDEVCVESGEPARIDAPYDLVRTMRASFMVLGPLLARCGHARVSLPGGCAIGTRPVDQHIKGLAALGAKIELSNGYVEARAPRLRGASFAFDLSTVNGTQNVLMAACLADGTSVLGERRRRARSGRARRGAPGDGRADRGSGDPDLDGARRVPALRRAPLRQRGSHRGEHAARRRGHHGRRGGCDRGGSI